MYSDAETRVQHFSARPENIAWGNLDASAVSIGKVASGETFTADSTASVATGIGLDRYVSDERKALENDLSLRRGPGPHCLTGPLDVEDADVGDTLEVRIGAIGLRQDYGFQKIEPKEGVVHDVVDETTTRIVPLDRDRGLAHVLPRLAIDVRPFFGIIAVSPRNESGRVSSLIPGDYGGNMDYAGLTSGTRLFLPVQVPGAKLYIGDGHAAQGAGEVCHTAIETSLRGSFTVKLHRRVCLQGPWALTSSQLVIMGCGKDLNEAARSAVQRSLDLLTDHYGLERSDAYGYLSAAADLRITQAVNPVKGVHMEIPREHLRALDDGVRVLGQIEI